jgi:hypothetical protein
MHSSNTCDMYEGFCIGLKILLKAFFFCSLFPYPPQQPALQAPHRIAFIIFILLPPLLPATSDTTHTVT